MNTKRVWIEFSKSTIKNNLAQLRRLTGINEIFVNVEANALGFGVVPFIRGLVAGNVAGFAVRNLQQALELRQWGTNKPILFLDPIDENNEQLIREQSLIMPVYSLPQLKLLTRKRVSEPLLVTLMYSREGLATLEQIQQAKLFCQRHSRQLLLWGFQGDNLKSKHFNFRDHFNSTYSQKRINPIIGSAIYGFCEQPKINSVFNLKTQIIKVEPFETNYLATIPLGFIHGFSSHFANFPIIINGQRQAIIKEVSLNQTKILLKQKFPIGTIVTIFGQDQNCTITLTQGADYLKIQPWELTTMLNPLIPRQLIKK